MFILYLHSAVQISQRLFAADNCLEYVSYNKYVYVYYINCNSLFFFVVAACTVK